ncbi:MAG: HAMP domain-containing histidine kinase [Calditrichaeota bacterium]|nr:HAMP domain-containing histidine kinase [Calditrichota bacterium]
MRSLSVRYKIILLFSLITVILVIVLSRISYVTVREIYLEQAAGHVKTLTSLAASDLDASYLLFLTAKADQAHNYYQSYLDGIVRQTAVANAFIFNKNLDVLVSSEKHRFGSELILNRSEIERLTIHQSGSSFPFADSDQNWYIWGFYNIDDRFYLGIRENINRLERINQLSTIFFWIGAAGVLLTVMGGWIIARTVARPVDKLVEFSKKIGRGDFEAQVPDKIYGEFALLKETMQQMQTDLAAKNDEREQLLAQIAHEIRNPLGGIELLAGLIKEDSLTESPAHNHSSKILQEVSGLKEQIAAFLYYNKPIESKPQQVQLKDILKDVKLIHAQRLQDKNIKLNFEDADYPLFFDPQHLKQVLTNLTANSIDAVEENGHISIKTFKNGSHGFEVCDNGPGLDPKYRKNIFKPFFTTKSNGSGLGLAICKKLCQQNNALLEYDENYKDGSRFIVITKE